MRSEGQLLIPHFFKVSLQNEVVNAAIFNVVTTIFITFARRRRHEAIQ